MHYLKGRKLAKLKQMFLCAFLMAVYFSFIFIVMILSEWKIARNEARFHDHLNIVWPLPHEVNTIKQDSSIITETTLPTATTKERIKTFIPSTKLKISTTEKKSTRGTTTMTPTKITNETTSFIGNMTYLPFPSGNTTDSNSTMNTTTIIFNNTTTNNITNQGSITNFTGIIKLTTTSLPRTTVSENLASTTQKVTTTHTSSTNSKSTTKPPTTRKSTFPATTTSKITTPSTRATTTTKRPPTAITTTTVATTAAINVATTTAARTTRTPPLECKKTIEGENYRGSISVTVSGIPCQEWGKQTPHAHHLSPKYYTSANLESNYCRNPDKEPSGPWCYTMSPDQRWEYCNIPMCEAEL